MAHRDGPDGIAATEDDDLFDSLVEVENVYWVGDWTVDWLLGCADELGCLPTYDEAAALLMLNDAVRTDVSRLDHACGVRLDSAANLIAHRDGADGLPATADDDRFDSFAEIESVHMVGQWTTDRIVACANRLEYAAADAIGTPLADLVEAARTAHQ